MRKDNNSLHIGIAGNIGSGKTSLTTLLSKHYKWKAYYESVDGNPYLDDFYEDMQRWSFNLQVYFLNSRFRQVLEIRNSGETVIQDRTIYEDAYIFAPNLHDMGLMDTRDYQNYVSLFKLMTSLIDPPDLLIYLKCSVPTLVRQIEKRGRNYETKISIDYLKNLNERYDKWIDNYNLGDLLVIDADRIDFIENKEDFSEVLDKIDAKLFGIF